MFSTPVLSSPVEGSERRVLFSGSVLWNVLLGGECFLFLSYERSVRRGTFSSPVLSCGTFGKDGNVSSAVLSCRTF